ncbi:hypothetical protein JI76_28475 [Streptomyces anulatus]|uniref:hypothetical protein n=1 Tax=Streptomyces anulatus TaxID=1892 RepID=UPI0006D94EBD|nr:hypothetical protein [Streptomyces anulatus]KPL29062.1 hypothetical protein JI76_28475 [Streptomyces anulatus]
MATHILTPATARLALISCAIRNKGTGWELITDAAHAPSGVTGVVQHPDHLEIKHAVGAVKVSSMQVTPDEYYAAQGLRCGASVGLALSRVYLYSGPSITPVDPAALVASSGNLWITGFLELPPA